MANINKPLSQMTFSQAENLARQRNLTPSKYGATLAGTWTNQGLADALGVSIVKPSRSVYSSGQKVLATPTALKPPPTKADVLSQAQSLGDTTYGITQSPYNAATDVARTRYLNQVLPGKMTPLKAMAQGVGVTPEELNAAYLAGQQKGQQRDTTWTQTKAELDSRGAPDWFKVASALAGAHMGAQNLGSSLIPDPALQLTDAAKVGLSAYSGYKSPENISTNQILNTSLPSPMMAEGGLVGCAGGGQYSATGIRPTPEQRPVVGALARMVQGVDKFARAPFGYTNPPVEAISDFLRVPELYRTMENYAYGSPLASGTSPVSRYLPRLSEDTKGAIEATTNLIPLVGPTMRATKATARAAAPYAAQQAVNLVEKYGVAPTMNVIKPKGGNWLAGRIEESVAPLRSKVMNEDPAERLKKAEDYFAEYTARGIPLDPAVLERERARLAPDVAINRWIDNKLNKYIRNEMATPEDPIRALAEEGTLHFSPTEQNMPSHGSMLALFEERGSRGFPREGLAKSELARKWEAMADVVPNSPLTARQVASNPNFATQNPWAAKINPETEINWITPGNQDFDKLGFQHLIDELKAAMSPTSELPQHLRLDPKDIDKVTVPQAVERVSKINAWRAEQAAQAEKAGMMANLQATPRLADESLQLSFVEKPGGAWVDIPETINEEGMKLCTSIGKAGGWCTKNEGLAKTYGSGENRLATLLDAEGRPHAQAKITTDADHLAAFEAATETLTPQQVARWEDDMARIMDRPPELEEGLDWMEHNAPEAYTTYKRILADQGKNSLPDITELKPPGNSFNSERAQEYAKRDPQYKNKVTQSVLNFLNNGQWGYVADLHHYDIVDLTHMGSIENALQKYYGSHSRQAMQDFNKAFENNPSAPRFMTETQFYRFLEPSVEPPGYGVGGAVKSFAKLVRNYLANEGKVAEAVAEAAPKAIEAAPKEQKMLQGFYRGYAGENTPAKTAFGTETYFVSPQRKVADYYAQRRAAELGADPHAEMILADPFTTRNNPYGLSIPIDKYNRDFLMTRARRVDPDEVKSRTPLYARGGAVQYNPDEIAQLAASVVPGYAQGGIVGDDQAGVNRMVDQQNAAEGGYMAYAAGGLVNYDPAEIDTIVSRIREELHG